MLINHSTACAHNVVLHTANIGVALQRMEMACNHGINASFLKQRLNKVIPLR
jgi:hypothetical protein